MLDGKLGGLFGAGPKSLSEDLSELKQDLSTMNASKQRAALHRVMTLLSSGRNVSVLFPEVLNAMHSSQLDTKRLAHQFFLIYHRQFSDLSILAVNALKKDADDPNPLIRAQSLKTLAAIRLEDAAEYLVDPVRKGLNDPDPYVRKSAVLAVAKLVHFHRSLALDHGLVEQVLELLSDGNPAVVGNAAAAVGEFLSSKIPVTFDLGRATALLTALNDCSEWHTITILDLLFNVNAVFVSEVDSVVGRLVPLLSHGNAGVVLGAVRLIALLISRCAEFATIRSVLAKLVPPLVSFLGDSGTPQSGALQFEILRSIGLLAAKKTAIKMPLGPLLIKYADPVSVKKEKIKLLAKLDFSSDADRVLIELKEIAATELDVSVVLTAVDALASLAIRPIAPHQADKVVSALLDVLDAAVEAGSQTVSAQTQIKAGVLVNLVALIRAFPGEFEAVIATIIEAWAGLAAVHSQVTDAVAFVVAENAARVETETALSVFERIFASEAELSSVVLTSAIRLAVSVNNKTLLKKVIDRSTAPLSSVDPDIRDRGLFYAKLIQADPAFARQVLNAASGKRVRRSTAGPAAPDLSHIGRLSSMYDLPVVFRPRPLRDAPEGARSDDEDEPESPFRPASLVITSSAAPGAVATTVAAPTRPTAVVSRQEAVSSDSEGEEEVSKFLVLRADQAGAPGGVRGLRVAAGLGRTKSGAVVLALTVGNGASDGRVLTSPFLVQLNKNSAGLSPKVKLIADAPAELKPGEAFHGSVELVQSEAMRQGQGPLTSLQVAVKTQEDVWYFAVPVSL